LTLVSRLRRGARKHLLVAAIVPVMLVGGALAGGSTAFASAPHSTPPGAPWPAATSKIFLYVDTEAAATEGIYGDCQQGNDFQQGQQVLFRVAGTQTSSGAALQPSGIRILAVDIPGQASIPFVWGEHDYGMKPGTTVAPEYWTAVWKVPSNYPLGNVNFYIHVVLKNSSSTSLVWKQIPLVASSLTIVKA